MDVNTISLILGALLAVSEALSLIPQVKANGVFQLAMNILVRLCGKGGA
jgi:hypothetical protein